MIFHTYSSANILAARETWSFGAVNIALVRLQTNNISTLTDNQGNHRGSISSSGFQALDQFLHLPNLDVLLRLVGLSITHFDS